MVKLEIVGDLDDTVHVSLGLQIGKMWRLAWQPIGSIQRRFRCPLLQRQVVIRNPWLNSARLDRVVSKLQVVAL